MDAAIYFDGREAGRVLSGGYSPVLKNQLEVLGSIPNFWEIRNLLSWESEVRETRVSISFSLPVMKK